MELSIVLMSFGVGVLIGLTSMGGAALMSPFLILILGVRPVTAVGTDLVYSAITKMVGAWVHLRQGTVDLAVVRKLATGSVPGGLAGALLIVALPRITDRVEHYVQRAIAALLVVVAVTLAVRIFLRMPALPLRTRELLYSPGTLIWGAVVGCCVGATSVGSGSLVAPLLMIICRNPAKVVGTDVFHAAILVTVTASAHAAFAAVEWPLVPILLAGSIPGVLLGSKLACHIPARTLRTGLAALLLLTAYGMF